IRRYVGEAVRDIVDEAVRRAVDERTEQVIRAFRGSAPAIPTPAPPHAATPKASKPAAANGAADYGAISKPMRRALMVLRSAPGGVSANDVQDYCRHNLDTDLTIQQVRSILKVFARRGEATRLERGRYTAGPKLLASESGQPDMWQPAE